MNQTVLAPATPPPADADGDDDDDDSFSHEWLDDVIDDELSYEEKIAGEKGNEAGIKRIRKDEGATQAVSPKRPFQNS